MDLWSAVVGAGVTVLFTFGVNAIRRRLRTWRRRRALLPREALKVRVEELVKRRAGGPGRLIHRDEIARQLQLLPTELLPLLDDLVAARRIFRSMPPMPPDYYSMSDWRPDPSRLYGHR